MHVDKLDWGGGNLLSKTKKRKHNQRAAKDIAGWNCTNVGKYCNLNNSQQFTNFYPVGAEWRPVERTWQPFSDVLLNTTLAQKKLTPLPRARAVLS